MHYVAKRLGFHLPRSVLVLVLVAALLAIGAYWIGPFRPLPADLRVLALSADGRFKEDISIPSRWVDTLPAASEATARFPLILAVHNAGAQAAQPAQLALSLPAHVRLATNRGPLERHTTVGNPLARYEIPISTPTLEPGGAPALIGGVDTLWLEPVVPTMYCVAFMDSVPDFVAAPAQDPQALARLRIFYSLEGRSIRQRQAGLLQVQLDPNLVARRPAPAPPVFETVITKPEAPAPALSELREVGTRTSSCGEPSQPLQLHTVLYETVEGGRFFVLYHGGAPRKHLYDLNRDSIIELEMWDADGDGKFEARRPARYAVPAFLMPFPETVIDSAEARLAIPDTVTLDSAWLRTFHDTVGGPLRFAQPRTGAPRPATTPPTNEPVQAAPVIPGRVDSAALRIFHMEDAGPLRFIRAQQGDTIKPPPPPPRPRQERPRLLGVPYNSSRQ